MTNPGRPPVEPVLAPLLHSPPARTAEGADDARGEVPMKSSWPIVLGFIAVAYAAVWYDARNEATASPGVSPANASASLVARP
jgi:hypothetical protein